MKPMFSTSLGRLAAALERRRETLWNALECVAMPVFILYPQLAVLKWYRYGS